MKFPLKDIKVAQPVVAFAAAGIGWLALDQFTKFLQRIAMTPGQSIPLIQNVFHLTYVRNEGAAFSVLSGKTYVFLIATFISCVAIWLFWRLEKPTTLLPIIGSGMLVGGSLGNAIDRVAFGHVLDIFDARIINFAVFNLADTGITIGVALLIIWMIFFDGFASSSSEEDVPSEADIINSMPSSDPHE